jgi:hypothetical protein
MISALSTLHPLDGYQILDRVRSRRKLCLALANPDDGITYGCHSLVEGVPMLILLFELMDSVRPPQAAPLGGLASCKLLL